jgi:hypothetical protein
MFDGNYVQHEVCVLKRKNSSGWAGRFRAVQLSATQGRPLTAELGTVIVSLVKDRKGEQAQRFLCP